MDLFDSNGVSSEEWNIFLQCFPTIGSFKLPHTDTKASVDDNVYNILGIRKKTADGKMPKDELFALIDVIEKTPVENQKNLYLYKHDGEKYWVKLQLIHEKEYLLGFVQDATHEMMSLASTTSASDFDNVTHLYNRDAFIRKVRTLIANIQGGSIGCMAVLHINGIERIDSELNYDKTKRCIASVGEVLKRFENENAVIGVKSYKEFFIYFSQQTKIEIISMLRKISNAISECKITDDFGATIETRQEQVFTVNCGYCWYPEQAGSIDLMINYADFALFETLSIKSGKLAEFSFKNYLNEKINYDETQFLNDLIENNKFEYHFQPIVLAETGGIMGYEALMRPKNSTPLKVLELARRHDRLEDIERLTFSNVLDYVSKNREYMREKKIFINSIPDHLMPREEFDKLCNQYSDIMSNVVIEITEQADITDAIILRLKNACRRVGCQIAIDDYGSGYSNTSTLLKCLPNYVKIDYSLISEINKNTKKQHLLSGIIDFAKLNNITVLAEGVETYEELKVVIRRGVDLIQGFYTCHPKPVIVRNLCDEIVNDIVNINLTKPEINIMKSFTLSDETPISIINLSLEKYTDIFVTGKNVFISGENDNTVNMNITVIDNITTTINLSEINMRGIFKPCISLGNKTNVTLVLDGVNTLTYEGICVPENSSLRIIGKGDLLIDSFHNNGCSIGTSFDSPYGNIDIDIDGTVEVVANGDHSVCVGGGRNAGNSHINIDGGTVKLMATGTDALAMGTYDGIAVINVNENVNMLDVTTSGANTVGIGCFKGNTNITLNSKCALKCAGKETVGIGVLNKGTGQIQLENSNMDITVKARIGACIGTNNGSINTSIINSEMNLHFEGDEIAGLGDCRGGGNIYLNNAKINVDSVAGEQSVEIGTKMGETRYENSEINAKILNAVNM